MKIVPSVVALLCFFCGFRSSRAANQADEFETRPNAPNNWQVGTVSQKNPPGGWSFSGGALEVSRALSVSGDQSLKFTSSSAAGTLSHAAAAGSGVRFLDVSLRLPVGKTIPVNTVPSWTVAEAQLVIDSVPAMIVQVGSATSARLYMYSPAAGGTWTATGPALLIAGVSDLKNWLRLTLRTDPAASISDLWIDGKLAVINHPPNSPASGSFVVRAATGKYAFIDDFQTGDAHPLYADADKDAMPDSWEYENSLDASADDRESDKDYDGVTNITEYLLGTKANDDDSDDDGMLDGWEYYYALNPASASDKDVDLDLDGYTNSEEFTAQTNPNDASLNAGTATSTVVYARANAVSPFLGTFNQPFANITDAIAAVPAGGRVVLQGGGNVFIGTGNQSIQVLKPVTIVGTQGATIVGDPTHSCFYTTAPSAGPFVVEGLTITSFREGFGQRGAAIFSDGVPVTIRRCTISACFASSLGGGVFVNGAPLTAEDCTFSTCQSGYHGGACYAQQSAVKIRRCRFTSNYTTNGDGPALFFQGGSCEIENCYIGSNFINTTGRGAVGFAGGVTGSLSYCTILSNTARTESGGLFNGNAGGTIALNSCILWDNRINGGAKSQLNGTTLWSATYCTVESVTVPPVILPGSGNDANNPNFLSGTPILRYAWLPSAANPNPPRPTTDIEGVPRLPAPQLTQRGAFAFADTDGDGMPSSWEIKYQLNPNDKTDGDKDADQDGFTNIEEYANGSDPRYPGYESSVCIFVDAAGISANDANYGYISSPVRTISRALQLLVPNTRNRICLRDGTYSGNLNRDLSTPSLMVSGTIAFTLKSLNGPGSVVIELEDAKGVRRRFLTSSSYYGSPEWTIRGIEFRHGLAPAGGSGGVFFWQGYTQGLMVYDCTFTGCKAVNGGAISYQSSPGSAGRRFQLTNCVFQGCEATSLGGAVHSGSTARFSAAGCTFAYNAAAVGGGVYCVGPGAGLNLNGCVFFRNTAGSGGGASLNSLTGYSTFSGEFYTNATVPVSVFDNVLANCVFAENVAHPVLSIHSEGGGVVLNGCNTDLHGCRFTGNIAESLDGSSQGGALFVTAVGGPSVFSSDFHDNEAAERGGAIYVRGVGPGFFTVNGTSPPNTPAGVPSVPRLANCAIRGNTAGAVGGGVFVGGSEGDSYPDGIIVHCTLTGNHSGAGEGGAIYASGDAQFFNNIAWFNTPALTQVFSPEGTLAAAGNNSQQTLPGGVSIRPTLAFDGIHIAAPLPPEVVHLLGGANPAHTGLAVERPAGAKRTRSYDFDLEPRPGSSIEAGCDEWVDSDPQPDGLPDWFELYVINLSPNDAFTSFATVTPDSRMEGSGYKLKDLFNAAGDPGKPDAAQPKTDTDEDGVTDLEEIRLGLDPSEWTTRWYGWHGRCDSEAAGLGHLRDFDGDGVMDSNDAVPNSKELKFFRTPTVRYVPMYLTTASGDRVEGKPLALNNRGDVLFSVPDPPGADDVKFNVWIASTKEIKTASGSGHYSGEALDFDDEGRALLDLYYWDQNLENDGAYLFVPETGSLTFKDVVLPQGGQLPPKFRRALLLRPGANGDVFLDSTDALDWGTGGFWAEPGNAPVSLVRSDEYWLLSRTRDEDGDVMKIWNRDAGGGWHDKASGPESGSWINSMKPAIHGSGPLAQEGFTVYAWNDALQTPAWEKATRKGGVDWGFLTWAWTKVNNQGMGIFWSDDHDDFDVHQNNSFSKIRKSLTVPGPSMLSNCTDINQNGVILAWADHTNPMLLMPVRVDAISRDPITGVFSNLGGSIPHSPLSPTVTLTTVSSTISPTKLVTVSYTAKARDIHAEMTGSASVANLLDIYVNGVLKTTATGTLINQGGALKAPWEKSRSECQFQGSFTIQVTDPQPVSLGFVTRKNAAEKRGRADATVVLDRVTYQPVNVPPPSPVSIFFVGGEPSNGVRNSVTLSGGITATLQEPVGHYDGLYFEYTTAQNTTYGLNLRTLDPPSATARYLSARLEIRSPTSTTAVLGTWQETGGSTRLFNCVDSGAMLPASEALRVIDTVITDPGTDIEDPPQATPFALRLTVPKLAAPTFTPLNGMTPKMNGVPVILKTSPTGDLPPVDPLFDQLYVTAPTGELSIFAANSKLSANYCLNPAVTKLQLEQLQAASAVQMLEESRHTTGVSTPTEEPPPADDPYVNPGGPYTFEDVRMMFGLLNGPGAAEVLEWYENQGLAIKINETAWWGDPWDWYWDYISGYDAILRPDKTPTLWLSRKELPTLEKAVQGLAEALVELQEMAKSPAKVRSTLRIEPSFWEDLGNRMADGTTSKEEFIRLWQQGLKDAVSGSFSAFGRSFAESLSIYYMSVGVMVMSYDGAKAISEGDAKAGAVSLFVTLLTVKGGSMARTLHKQFKAGRIKKLVLKLPGGGRAEIKEAMIAALDVATRKHDYRSALFVELRPMIADGRITRQNLEDLWKMGITQSGTTKGSALLGRRLGDKPHWAETRPAVAHHDYPQDMEEYFAKRGIDVHEGTNSGRWLPADFHYIVNGKGLTGFGETGNAFNYQWERWRALNPNATLPEIEAFKEKLVGKTMNFEAKSIDWEFTP